MIRLATRLARTIATAAADAADTIGRIASHVAQAAQSLWQRHNQLMEDEPVYRAEVLAAASAVIALLGLPGGVAATVLAFVGVYVAAFGPTRDRRDEDPPRRGLLWDQPDW